MTRIGLAPVLGYLILEEDFNVALGVFALAGLTDLVSYEYVWFFLLPSKSHTTHNSPGVLEGQPQHECDLALCVRTCLQHPCGTAFLRSRGARKDDEDLRSTSVKAVESCRRG